MRYQTSRRERERERYQRKEVLEEVELRIELEQEKELILCRSLVYVHICKQTFILIQRKTVFPAHDVFMNYLYSVNVICVLM
jgi:hypothetical protein